MEKAATTDADAVIFDLEDAIPEGAVPESRERIANVTEDTDFGTTEVCVRINGSHTNHWLADLRSATAADGVHTVIVPMVESSDQLRTVTNVARTADGRTPELLVIAETPRGVAAAHDIARCATKLDPVTGFSYGFGDYTKAIGATGRPDSVRDRLEHTTVEAAAIGGLDPLASVYQDFRDGDGLRACAERARAIGFVGMKAIHPAQIETLNGVFTPTREDVERARTFVETFDEDERDSLVVDGVFLDTAIVDQYRTVLDRHEEVSA